MKIELFDYELPRKFIAQEPLPRRDESKLLILDRKTGEIKHDIFYNIPDYFDRGDVLAVNESKVIRCRIMGKKEGTGAGIECFVLNRVKDNQYMVLIKPSKRVEPSDKIIISSKYFFTLKTKLDYGRAIVKFNHPVGPIFKQYGRIPLPPYIKSDDIDESRYQTIYAGREGSSAAPTAGLHFTDELIKRLKSKGVIIAKLCLEIGLDTFRQITEDEIEKGRRIIAVGTTTVRVLETLIKRHDKITADSGMTDIFIYPGFEFKAVDWMITNFHLPRSTLLVMVSAFAGRENILNAYEKAKQMGYRFYSFGDCMLIK